MSLNILVHSQTSKDHLGSASVITDGSGNIVGETRYFPYGETRFTIGTMHTDKLYTGQREIDQTSGGSGR